MNILVITTDYPNLKGGLTLAYVRTRNILYREQGANVEVINFATKENYEIDGINVYPVSWFNSSKAKKYDVLISHAPNLRNHYAFLLKYGKLFKKKVFFFHGHEVLKINKVYSKPYPYIKKNRIGEFLQNRYDDFKFFMWRKYFEKNYNTSYFIFVSKWMKKEFLRWVHPASKCLENRSYITYNCVGKIFEESIYDKESFKLYDFVTVRANLDGSKYSIDIVNNLAKRNPCKQFLLIGQGIFFDHYEKAPNLIWRNCRLNHQEMIQVLNSAKCALMPTRTDAQGVMMCEMTAFGMPLITSDIPVCHEVFNGAKGVGFIDNENYLSCDLTSLLENVVKTAEKNTTYYNSIVGIKEFNILKEIVQ